MTNIIVGQSISGSLTSTSPKIVDPTSPFNGQFYDDFDLSVSVIDFNNLPFLQAASKEFGDIGSVKIGETRSTNIFVQPPAGSAPGASTVIQLINTITNSVDAQSISTSSEALKFVKNAEIVGTNYTIRVINAVPGEYKISLAGAIQAVQITNGTPTVAAGLPPAVMIDPAIGSQINPNPNSPDKPVTALISNDETATAPVVDQPNPTPITGGRFNSSSNAGGFNSSAAGGFNSSSAGGVPVLTSDRPDRPVTALISNDETATAPVVDQPNPTPITGGRFNSSNAGGFNSSAAGGFNSSSAGGVPVSTPDRPDRPVTALISNDETATAPVVDQPNPTPITAGSETNSPNAGGQPTGIDSGVPIVVAIDPPTGNPPILTLSDGTVLSEQIPIVGDNPKSVTEVDPTLFARNFASPTPPTPIDLTNPISDNPALPIPLIDAVFSEAPTPTAIIDPIVGSEPIPIRGANPPPNARGGDSAGTSTTTEELPLVLFDSTAGEIPLLPIETLSENDPRIFQSGVAPNSPEIATGELPLVPVDPKAGETPLLPVETLSENDPRIFQSGVAPNPPEIAFTSPAPLFDRNGSFLSVFRAVGFGISATSRKPSSKVNEIGIFVVDDASGKINGIAPGAAGYLKAATDSARSIFSTLGGDFFESSRKREVVLERNTYGFFEVQDGSIADVKQQIANGQTPTNVLFSTPNANGVIPIQLTGKDTDGDFFGDYNLSVNKDELVLSVTNLNVAVPTIAIGAKSQGLAEGRTIDLTGITGSYKADITTKSSAAYTNNIGFYKVEDSIGTILLADGTTVKPGDAKYAFEAVKNALANTSLQAGKTESKLGQNITGGSIYAPVVVSQGTLSDFIATNPTNIGGSSNNAYFNYVLGNSDKKDHFRLLGDNTFGVEDQFGGGDRDFNDLIVNVNVKPA